MKRIFWVIFFIIFPAINTENSNALIDYSLPNFEASYGVWKVFTIEQNGQKICYTTSTPVSMQGNHNDDRDAYIMVSLFGNVKKEISIVTGYHYKTNSIVNISIDGQQERFIAENETIAWPEKIGSDKHIINKMLNGFKILVFAESRNFTYSVDTYSLSGFKKSYNKILELCR